MKKSRKNQSGFTLIELLIVVIIVAVLAVVGVPLLRGNVERAKLTEADSGLSVIRTAMRAYLAEHSTYIQTATGVGTNGDFSAIGIKAFSTTNASDLDGRFFSQEAYSFGINPTATTFCAGVSGVNSANNVLPRITTRASEVNGTQGTTLNRSMDERGHIYSSINCTATSLVN